MLHDVQVVARLHSKDAQHPPYHFSPLARHTNNRFIFLWVPLELFCQGIFVVPGGVPKTNSFIRLILSKVQASRLIELFVLAERPAGAALYG